MPEAAVAYELAYIRDICKLNKLKIIEPIHYGFWPGRKDFMDYQDIIFVEKDTKS